MPRNRTLLTAFAAICLASSCGTVPDWDPDDVRVTGRWPKRDVTKALRSRIEASFPDLAEVTDGRPIALLVFKSERSVELWKQRADGWIKVRDYPFTGFSGELGPKLRNSDDQIPEGVYRVTYLNPNSRFHLSLKIDYPNRYDRSRARRDGRRDLGGDIFIHGKSDTTGCIPVGDRAIEEIFFVVAENGSQVTRVIISPYDVRAGNRALEIGEIDWEGDLYARIREALEPYR